METHVQMKFSNLILPSNEVPIQMELSYEAKKLKFNYPQTEPLKIIFSQKFMQDKISLVLSATIEPAGHNKKNKNKISFRSDISLNKSIFLEHNKNIYEKTVTMIPIEKMKEMKEMKDMKKVGKINMQIQLMDPFEDWKKNAKSINKKKSGTKIKNTNTSNSESMSNNNKISEGNTSNKKQSFSNTVPKASNENNITDTHSEAINEYNNGHENEENNEDNIAMNELNKLISSEQINQLKEIINKDYKKIFPNDINALKKLNENLYQKYNQLSTKYNEIIEGLNNTKENLRKKAIECYEEYKSLQSQLEKKMREHKQKQIQIDNELMKKKQEKYRIESDLEKYNNARDIFFRKLESSSNKEQKGSSKEIFKEEKNMEIPPSIMNNQEIKNLREALKKISSLGYDLVEGLDITDEEKKILDIVLNQNIPSNTNKEEKIKNNENENKEDDGGKDVDDNEDDKGNYELSNQIVGLIERDVNDLYMRKLIEQVKIDQIDAITYSFQGNKLTKEVKFKIENKNLVCNTGESFTVWLISNFSL